LQPGKQLKLFDLFPILIECLPKYIKNFKPQLEKEASYQRFLDIIPTENRQGKNNQHFYIFMEIYN